MIEIESVVVKLGGNEYTIQQAGFTRSKPWKKRLLEEIKPLFDQIGGVSDIQFNTPGDLVKLLPIAESLFLEGIETILDLLVAYSAELEADREYIETYATDKQIFAAFQEVVKLADFFGVVNQLNRRIGRETIGTLSNLQSVNGVVA